MESISVTLRSDPFGTLAAEMLASDVDVVGAKSVLALFFPQAHAKNL